LDTQKFLEEIIEYAEQDKPVTFRFIRSKKEYSSIKAGHKATKLIIKSLRASKKNLFKKYCSDILKGSADVNKLLACCKLEDLIEFYSKELDVLTDMLDEYDAYLSGLNLFDLLDALLSISYRPFKDLWDHREKKN
jgi:hypothetical protein